MSDDPEKLPLAHRDDLPPELLEAIQQQFPGMKIVCSGDAPGGEEALPPEIREAMERVEAQHEASMLHGTCVDCGKKMLETWPPENEDWELPDGWVILTCGEQPVAFICGDCNEEGPEFIDLSQV